MADSIGDAGESAEEWARREREKAEQLLRSAARKEQGAEGERAVAAALRSLPSGHVVLHDLSIPGSRANVDHLVIAPTGVFVIDAKSSAGQLTAGDGTLWWKGTRRPIRTECDMARWEADQMAAWLGCPVETVLCYSRATLPSAVVVVERVAVTTVASVVEHIQSTPPKIPAIDVPSIVARASLLLRSNSSATPTQGWLPATPHPTRRTRTPQQSKSSRREGVAPVRAIGGLVAGLLLIVGAPAIARSIARTASTATAPTSAPPTLAPTTALPTTTSTTLVEAPPTVEFSCRSDAAHWTAHLAPTQFISDPTGYHVWWRTDDASPWSYWGVFRSGGPDVVDLGGLPPSTLFEVRYDRAGLADPSIASGQLTFVTSSNC